MTATEHHGPGDDPRWLDDPRNVTRIVYVLVGFSVLAFVADFFYTKKPFFAIEEVPAFYAIYGFVVSTALVLAAKQMRRVVGRPEDFYERHHGAPQDVREDLQEHDARDEDRDDIRGDTRDGDAPTQGDPHDDDDALDPGGNRREGRADDAG